MEKINFIFFCGWRKYYIDHYFFLGELYIIIFKKKKESWVVALTNHDTDV
jgi:hypothetical protein